MLQENTFFQILNKYEVNWWNKYCPISCTVFKKHKVLDTFNEIFIFYLFFSGLEQRLRKNREHKHLHRSCIFAEDLVHRRKNMILLRREFFYNVNFF